MIGGVTRRMLPHLSGVPQLHVNRPKVNSRAFIALILSLLIRQMLANLFGVEF